MTPELMKLAWVLALTAVLWIPYILNQIMVQGLADGRGLPARAVVLATGTFLRAVMHVGEETSEGGRAGEAAARGLSADVARLAPWAQRAKKAHYNAVENLVVFAAAVLSLNALGVSNDTTILACNVYFWARVVHFVVYTAGVPWLRTLSFVVGWLCTAALILQLF